MALRNDFSPYVHSNIYNFIDFTVNETVADSKTLKDLEETIKAFEKGRDILQNYESQIYAMVGVGDYKELNKRIFGEAGDRNLDQIAHSVLGQIEFVSRLIPHFDKNSVKKLLKGLLGSEILNKVQEDIDKLFGNGNEIPLNNVTTFLVEELKKSFGTNSDKVSKRTLISNISKKKVQNALILDMKDWEKTIRLDVTSKKNHLNDFVKSYLKKNQKNVVTKPTFISVYKDCFKKLASKATLTLEKNQTLETVADNYANLYYNQCKAFLDNPYHSNLTGNFSEDGVVPVVKASNSGEITIDIVSVGAKKDEEIVKQYFNNNPMAKMNSYHSETKQSQTDLIVNLFNNGRQITFRVQAKNTIIDSIEKGENALLTGEYRKIAMSGKNSSIKVLLDRLISHNFLSKEDVSTISYLIANEVWFRDKGTINKDSKIEKRNTKAGQGLSGAIKLTEAILSKGIGAFIGLDINQQVGSINFEASNIFYLLGNKAFFPVSLVLSNAIKQMRLLSQHLLSSTNFYIDTTSAKYAYDNVRKFYDKKIEAVKESGGLGKASYQDSNLLSVGQAQGSSIMNSITGHVNFNFNLKEIFNTSSYVF